MTNNKKRIFILNYSGHSLANLKEFSTDIIAVTRGSVNLFKMDRLNFKISTVLHENNYDPTCDYIALSGHLILGYILGEVIGSRYHDCDSINVLLWDAVKRKYDLFNHNVKPELKVGEAYE